MFPGAFVPCQHGQTRPERSPRQRRISSPRAPRTQRGRAGPCGEAMSGPTGRCGIFALNVEKRRVTGLSRWAFRRARLGLSQTGQRAVPGVCSSNSHNVLFISCFQQGFPFNPPVSSSSSSLRCGHSTGLSGSPMVLRSCLTKPGALSTRDRSEDLRSRNEPVSAEPAWNR